MGKSQETFNKKEKEKKRLKKKQEKKEKYEERKAAKAEGEKGGLESMMAYIDENGNIVDTPPNPLRKKKIKAEDIELGVPKRVEENLTAHREGVVSFFNTSKGFGFIKQIGSGEDFFVHVNGLLEEITEGNKVTFELERGMKGMNAVKVRKVK
jgi:cold shock CspA family protein